MRFKVLALIGVALSLATPAGAAVGPESTSSSPVIPAEGRAAIERAAAARAAGDVITFDDYATGTDITDEYASEGVIFESTQLVSDGSNPTSPVLSGYPRFTGDVVGRFVDPSTGLDTTVDGFSMDVGYINGYDSVAVEGYDANGRTIGRIVAQSRGINTIDFVYRGVASFAVFMIDDEPAGFAIDNLVLGSRASPRSVGRMASFGDSYTSGEGLTGGAQYDCGTNFGAAPRYKQDTTLPAYFYRWSPEHCDTRTGSRSEPSDLASRSNVTHDNRCHRYGGAYPVLIRQALNVPGNDSIFVACSGAVTQNIGWVDSLEVQYPNSPVNVAGGQTQVQNVSDFARRGGDPGLITIGIGGNDAGFKNIIVHCLSIGCVGGGFKEGTINRIQQSVFEDVRTVLAGIRDRFPDSTTAMFGYPQVVGDPANTCVPGLSEEEGRWVKDHVIPTLNQTLADAAAEAGVTFVDISRVSEGHELCSSEPWVNGLIGTSPEGFHPRPDLHRAIAQYFLDHFTDGAGRLLFDNPLPSTVFRPAAGREAKLGRINTIVQDVCGTACQLPSACVQACAMTIQGSGYSPNTAIRLTLHSDPIPLGSAITDASGRLNTTISIPAGVGYGLHTIETAGTASDGTEQFGVALVEVYETPPDWAKAPVYLDARPPTTSPPAPSYLSILGWKGRTLRARVNCPATMATKTCRARLTVRKGKRKVAAFPKKGRTAIKRGKARTFRVTVPNSVARGASLNVTATLGVGPAAPAQTLTVVRPTKSSGKR